MNGKITLIVPLTILLLALVVILVFIYLQPTSGKNLAFSVPLVPFLPAFSIIINIYLMMMLDKMTWIRFLIWMTVGLGIYFFYGVWHSKMRKDKHTKLPENGYNEDTWKTNDSSMHK